MPCVRAVALLVLLAVSSAAAAAFGQQAPPPAAARHVLLISIDGLRPNDYLPSASRQMTTPVLDAIRARGSWAEGVLSQFPSLTYPAHTSIVTGVVPAKHGIVQNTVFAPDGGGTWFFEASALKARTLWETASAAGLTTAAVSWPVTVGARIDYLLPETNQAPRETTWLELMRRQSTPGLVDAVVERLGGFEPNANRDYRQRDRFAAAGAAHIIERYRPNLLLLHLVEADGARHQHGPDAPEAAAAIERIDGLIGTLVQSLEKAGIARETAIVVTGDHGFYRVHSAFQPNVVLRDAGLLSVDASGRITDWQAAAHRAGIRLKNPADEALAGRVERLFGDLAAGKYKGLFRIVDRAEIRKRGGDPDVLLFLEPVEGYTTSGGTSGEFLVASSRGGDHGYTPDAPAMHTGLILAGAGIRPGVVIPLARQIDIAPTVARLLGLAMEGTDGTPIVGVLMK